LTQTKDAKEEFFKQVLVEKSNRRKKRKPKAPDQTQHFNRVEETDSEDYAS
jgi:hypothetical protein